MLNSWCLLCRTVNPSVHFTFDQIYNQVAATAKANGQYSDNAGYFAKLDDAMFSLFVLSSGENYPEIMFVF